MIQPFYQEPGIVIYHGDNALVLPELGQFDLVLTDPPYGIGADKAAAAAASSSNPHGWAYYGDTDWDQARPGKEVFDQLLAMSEGQIIWGGNYFADMLPASMGWLVWDKGQRNFSLADVELAWTSFWVAARAFTLARSKALKDGKQHPTQKPLDLMKWCIQGAQKHLKKEKITILDPFMGSGTTLRAAKDLGVSCVGIDAEQKYCEIAAGRMSQGVLALF